METKDMIKAGRQRLGMTHQAFADAVGVSRGAVQQWEKGDTAPTRRHQPRVAAILDISVGELMGHVAIEEGAPTRSEPDQSQAQFQIQSQLFSQQTQQPSGIRQAIDSIGQLLGAVDERTRRLITELLLRYAQRPDDGDKVAQAIELLVSDAEENPEYDDASAPRPTIRPKFRKFSAVMQRQKKEAHR